jgi:hypothetical protein
MGRAAYALQMGNTGSCAVPFRSCLAPSPRLGYDELVAYSRMACGRDNTIQDQSDCRGEHA